MVKMITFDPIGLSLFRADAVVFWLAFDLIKNEQILTAMPKLYEYFGLIAMFYANEHEPVHVRGKCQGRESKAEIIVIDGMVNEIRYSEVAGRAPLELHEMQYFQELVSARADDIVRKWIDFFVLHKSIKPERITGRLK